MYKPNSFVIENLHASVEGKPILKGVNLKIESGEVHALMGPNGSGKTTLANVIMGYPHTQVTQGKIYVNETDILPLPTDERARLGVFLAFQYPSEISGITVGKFLKRALDAKALCNREKISVSEFMKELKNNLELLGLSSQFANRYLNEGFSGGEKKRMEMVQMLMLKPRLAILDEPDSGLDIDAVKIVAQGLNKLQGPEFGALVITHYQRILNYIQPHHIHILYDGRIVTSGGPELSKTLEEKGYDWVKEQYGKTE